MCGIIRPRKLRKIFRLLQHNLWCKKNWPTNFFIQPDEFFLQINHFHLEFASPEISAPDHRPRQFESKKWGQCCVKHNKH